MCQFVEEQRTLRLQHLVHALRPRTEAAQGWLGGKAAPQAQVLAWQQHQRCARQGVARHGRCQPAPGELPAAAGIVEPVRAVVLDARRQQFCLPGPGGAREALQLAQYFGHRLRATQALVRRQVLPVEQKTHEVLQADRFDLPAQAFDRVAVYARQ
ncbi:hypothetical protein D3C81_1253760 [compost metagenome]